MLFKYRIRASSIFKLYADKSEEWDKRNNDVHYHWKRIKVGRDQKTHADFTTSTIMICNTVLHNLQACFEPKMHKILKCYTYHPQLKQKHSKVRIVQFVNFKSKVNSYFKWIISHFRTFASLDVIICNMSYKNNIKFSAHDACLE